MKLLRDMWLKWDRFRGYCEVIDPHRGVIHHARTNLRVLRWAFRSCPE